MGSFETNTLAFYFTATTLTLCFFIISLYNKFFTYWKKRGLDDLQPLVPFGNTLDLVLKKVTLGELIANHYLKIKKLGLKHAGFYAFWAPIYIPVDPVIIKHILIRDFENFPNRGLYINEKVDPFSGHIFNMENEKWRNLRAKIPAAFTSAKMRQMFVIMEKMTQQLVLNMDMYAVGDSPLDIKNELSRFTTDVISSCAFGLETKTMNRQNEELLKQGRSFFDVQFHVNKNSLVLTIPRNILKKFNFRLMTRDFEAYFFKLFETLMKYRKEEQVRRGDLTDILLRLMEENKDERDFSGKKPMDPLTFEEFATQAVVFFAAGFETTSSTLTFALYELAQNPGCQTKLRGEIEEILAKYDNKVTYDALMEMKYLEQVIDETLRLYPILPILPRVCLNDYRVPGTDVILEKNTFVMISNMGIQRDPEFYPNPEKFEPERFSKENKAKRPITSHLPFGEGPRICVGKRFGLMQTKVGLITMLRNYEVSLDKKTSKSFKFEPNELILRKTGDIWLKIKKINM